MEKVMTAAVDRPGRVRRWLFGLGVLLLALALLAFLYEVFTAMNGGGYRAIAAGELWFRLQPYSLNLSQAIIQRYVHPGLWDPVIVSALQWPTWSLLGAPGAVLAILFHSRSKKEG